MRFNFEHLSFTFSALGSSFARLFLCSNQQWLYTLYKVCVPHGNSIPQISAFITNFRGVIQLPFFNWFCLVVGEDPQGKWIPGIKDMRNSFKSNKILHKEGGGAENLETIKTKRMAEYYFEWNKATKVTWNDMVFWKNIFSHETPSTRGSEMLETVDLWWKSFVFLWGMKVERNIQWR